MTPSHEIATSPATETNGLTLAALGASGSWEVSINRTASGPDRKFVQIEGPSVYLDFPLFSTNLLDEAIRLLTNAPRIPAPGEGQGSGDELSFVVGKATDISLLRDDEFDDRFFLLIRSKDDVTLRLTITKPELNHLSHALCQVRSEMDDE